MMCIEGGMLGHKSPSMWDGRAGIARSKHMRVRVEADVAVTLYRR